MSIESLLIVFAVALVIIALIDLAYKYLPKFHSRVDAQVTHLHAQAALMQAQAAHVEQTIKGDASTLEKTIAAYEQQGVNKFRKLVLLAKDDLAAVEKHLGFKVAGAIAKDDPLLQTARDIISKQAAAEVVQPIFTNNTEQILRANGEAMLASPVFASPAESVPARESLGDPAQVFAGQPSPGSAIPV